MPAYRDEATGKWYSKFRYKNWRGDVKNKTKRGFNNKRDALQWEQEFKLRTAGDLDMTLEDFVEIYIEERFPRLKASTILRQVV